MKRYLRKFDQETISWVTRLPDWIRPVMLIATFIGQPPVTIGIISAILGYGFAIHNQSLLIVTSIGLATIIVTSILKLVLRRARPDNDYVKSMLIQTFSFPSGHAAGTIITLGLLTYMASSFTGMWTPIIVVLTVVACAAVGISRVYLGAHYPSDVIGGWIVGGLGMVAILAVGVQL
jgi:undecaprenyl-diphosphatase